MKYIINNKQVFDSIYKFIDSEFNSDGQMFYNIGYDYANDEETEDILWFYKVMNNGWEFEYYKPEWFTRTFNGITRGRNEENKKWLPLTPFVSFSDNTDFKKKMDGFFGEMWYPVFEKWFVNNFPELPVKTFIF